MLKVFNANNSDTATAGVIDELGRNNVEGSFHYVIVPDRFSLSVEKEIFERLGLPGACNIDVVSFTRLAVKILGSKAKKCLSKEGAVIVLRRVIEREKEKLVHYKAVASGAGFPRELFAVIASVRNSGYSPEDLEAIIPDLQRGTKTKAQDIALLYREYLKEIEGYFEDSTTRIDKLIKEIPTAQKIANADVYIVGFNTFSGKQKQVIAALMRRAKSVNIAVNTTNYGKNAELYPSEGLREVIDIAKENKVEWERFDSVGVVKEPFNTLNKCLFTHGGDVCEYDAKSNAVTLYQERNVFEEVNGIAHEIARLVRRENYRYKDIGIVNCESLNAPIIKSVFERYGIPLYTDVKYPLINTLVAGFVFGIMDVGAYNFKKDKVISFIKQPVFGLSPDERESFENTILAYNLNFNRYLEPLSDRITQKSPQDEETRKKLVALVSKYPQTAKTKEFCEITENIIKDYFKEGYVEEMLSGVADSYNIGVNGAAPAKLLEILEELKTLAGDEEYTLKKFAGVFAASVSALELSLIPQSVDSVFMGDIHESRYNKLKALFVICASADNLPTPHSYQAIISATDMDMLADNNFRLFPTPSDLIKEEEYLLLELFTKVGERLYIGGSTAAQDGAPLAISPVCKEVGTLLGIKPVSLFERYSLSEICRPQSALAENSNGEKKIVNPTKERQEDFAVSRENAFFAYLSNAKRGAKIGGSEAQIMANVFASLSEEDKAKAEKLLEEKGEEVLEDTAFYFKNTEGARATSVSEVECYYNCPYRHHLQYGLELKEREEGDMKNKDVGTFIHAMLENYFDFTMGKLDSMTAAEKEDCIERAIKKAEEDLIKSGEGDALEEFNKKAIEAEARRAARYFTDMVLAGDYRPISTELRFGGDNKLPPIVIETENNKYYFRGSIDRLDTCGDRAIIMDYKTGKVEDNAARANLYFGKKVQLFLYQQVAMNMGYKPSGAFYLPVRDTADKTKMTAVGELDLSEENVKALDNSAWNGYLSNGNSASAYYPIKIATDKNDAVKFSGGKGKINSSEALAKATEYAKDMVRKALTDIENGVIVTSPLKGCGFCSFADICKVEGERNKRRYTVAVKGAEFNFDEVEDGKDE